MLQEIEKNIRDTKIERSVYLREVLRRGVQADKEDRWLEKYAAGEAAMMELCRELNWTPWELLGQLKNRSRYLNVSLEDWLDSATPDLRD